MGRPHPLPGRYTRLLRRRLDALTFRMVVALQKKRIRSAAWMAEEVLRHDPHHSTALHVAQEARRTLGIVRAPGSGVLLARTPEKRAEQKLSVELRGVGLEAALRALEYDLRVEIHLDPALSGDPDFQQSSVRFQTRNQSGRVVLDHLVTDHGLAYRFQKGKIRIDRPDQIVRTEAQRPPPSDRIQIELAGSAPIELQTILPPTPSVDTGQMQLDSPRTRSELLLHPNGRVEEKRTALPPLQGATLTVRFPRRLRREDQVRCPVFVHPVRPGVGPLSTQIGPSVPGTFSPGTTTRATVLLSGNGAKTLRFGRGHWKIPIEKLGPDSTAWEVVSGTVRPGGEHSFHPERIPDRVHELRVYPSPAAFLPELLENLFDRAERGPFGRLYRRIGPFLTLEWARGLPGTTRPWLDRAIQPALAHRPDDWPRPPEMNERGPGSSHHNVSSITASLLDGLLRVRSVGLTVDEDLIERFVKRAFQFLDSAEITHPAIRWALLVDLVLASRPGIAERCLEELASTDFDAAGAHAIASALEACSRLGLKEEEAALLERLVARARPSRGGLAWGREGRSVWEEDSFAATARAVRVLTGRGPEPSALARRGFTYLVSIRHGRHGWGSARRNGALLKTILSLALPDHPSPEKSRVLRIANRLVTVSGEFAPQIVALDGWTPPNRRLTVSLVEGSRPLHLSLVYEARPGIPPGVVTLQRRVHVLEGTDPRRILVILQSEDRTFPTRVRLEEPLPAGTRLLALGHVTDHERKTLHIRGDGTFSMTLSPGPRGRPLLTYLLEMPFAGRFHVPQGRLTALDAPSLIALTPTTWIQVDSQE